MRAIAGLARTCSPALPPRCCHPLACTCPRPAGPPSLLCHPQAIILTSAHRHLAVSASSGSPLPPQCLLYLSCYAAASAACVAAYCAGGRWRARYMRHLELTAVVLRLTSFGLAFPGGGSSLGGAGWQLTRCAARCGGTHAARAPAALPPGAC